MWANVKTEFTFGQVFGHIGKVAEICAKFGTSAGIMDNSNTFGHVRWKKACQDAGIKPIYGVRLPVVENRDVKERRIYSNSMGFIAKNQDGLKEIYHLVDLAHKQFYYKPRIDYNQVNETTSNIYLLSGIAPIAKLIDREFFFELSPSTPFLNRKTKHQSIACIDNFYPEISDRKVYEPFADYRLLERRTIPLHIWSKEEWLAEFPGREDAIATLKEISESCNVELPKAHMVKYIGKDNIKAWCEKGAREKGIDIWSDGNKYADRYKREMELIVEKGYVDYFLVVADVIRYAKTKMAVGPSRGSSAGSLVCYLMGITEIDPLEYDLYFERFIDVNRYDLPDIDVDFQDDKRHLVISYLKRKYGESCVAQIGNINRLKPKSAIARFAKALKIPIDDVQEVKDAIMERSGGDARANQCIGDAIEETEVGKRFIEKYPNMKAVAKIEAHASHTGIHAAGILVCNEPITTYTGINSRDKNNIAMIDKKDAEKLNLLKIDALGLRTLSILANVCDQIGKPYGWLYTIPTDDQETFDVFNAQRFNGIFQFEGPAIKGLAKQMPIESMEDIAALSALGRPGPLSSGGANNYIKYRNNPSLVEYLSDHPDVVKATEGTYGIVIYQEQMLAISRYYGALSWDDCTQLRKAASKSLGDEFFSKYKDKFMEGATKKEDIKICERVWSGINTMGSWAFNKSHAVSYGLVSYLCGYMKAHYPKEFVVACLNHSRSDSSALKILRDAVENDGIKYKYIDQKISIQDWSVRNGILYGGLTTIHGIGPKNANKIVKLRAAGEPLPAGLQSKLDIAKSPFKYLYPAKQVYGDYYTNPEEHGLNGKVSKIVNCQQDGAYTIIGKLIKKNTRDSNEACFVTKRGGKYLTGSTTWINLTVEDDTDSIMAKISIRDYDKFGKEIAESGKEDEDWYMVHGEKINGWGLLFVKNIRKITRAI